MPAPAPRPATAEIVLKPVRRQGDRLVMAAEFRRPARPSQCVWFALPAQWTGWVSSQADPFLLALLFPIMRGGLPVRVHGPVSPALVENLDRFMAIWTSWRPRQYRRVAVTADATAEPPPAAPSAALLAFSAGLDSCFSAWQHRGGRCGRSVPAGLFVQGFDVPLRANGVYARAFARAAETLRSVDMELLPVATNYRALNADWRDSHGAALAASLALLAGGFRAGLVSASAPHGVPLPAWGSTVITDPLLSSLSFAIVHDGAEQHRVGKARALAAWPEALRNLRVCWAGRSADTNCGRCEKCVRTILEFRAAGVPCPPCFPGDVTEDQIRGLAMDGFAAKLILGRILREARATGYGRERWVRMLEERLSRPASRRLQTRAREWLRWSPVAEPARWLRHRWLGR